MTSVAVFGAKGRMGSTSVAAIEASPDLQVVATIDIDDEPQLAIDSGAEVALIFSTPDVAGSHAEFCIENGLHVVIGTSGFDENAIQNLRKTVADRSLGVLVVPNFSIGAVLLMSFAAKAAAHFESVEVIEMHHPNKVDAPSGTAVRTAEVVAAARAEAGLGDVPDATTTDPDGARGANVGGIQVHAVRARGFVASQEVIFGGHGELMSLRHDSLDRESFMPGVLTALRSVSELTGVAVGLDAVLDLA